eukprot:scaffold360139_cov93-Cyclotella_meneghiniana.AAC.2
MFASGERGRRYRLDPDQGIIDSVDEQHIPQQRSNRSIRTSDVSALTLDSSNEGLSRLQPMQSQRLHQSMKQNNMNSLSNNSINMTRQQSMPQQQRSHQSMEPVNFNSFNPEANSRQHISSEQFIRQKRLNRSMIINRSDGMGADTQRIPSRQQLLQQQRMRQSMQIPRNKDLRQSFPGNANDEQHFQPIQKFRSARERNSLARSMVINRDSQSMANFQERQSFLDDTQDAAIASESMIRRVQSNKLAKSMIVNRNCQSMAKFHDKQSFLDDSRDAAISSVSRRPQPNNLAKSMVINRISPPMANLQERRSLKDSLQNMSTEFCTEYYQPARKSSFRNDEQNANQLQHSDRLDNSKKSCEPNEPHSNTQQSDMASQPNSWIDGIVGEDTPAEQLHKSSFTSQGDKSTTETLRNSLSVNEHGVVVNAIQSQNDKTGFRLLKRDNSGWRTLSEDKSHIKYRRAIVGVVCGLVFIAGIVATVIVFAPLESRDNIQDQDNLIELPKDVITLPLPIRDIEGRCSPSNIHGSVDLCIEACERAACCYPSFTGQSCYDESNNCMKYRPYCDVIFAPWLHALEGAVAPPPDELFDRAEWDEVCRDIGPTATKLPNKKRLHRSIGSSLRDIEITPDLDAAAGVTVNEVGDLVETSCIDEKNLKHCIRYMEKCRVGDSTTSPPKTLNPISPNSVSSPFITDISTSPSSFALPPITPPNDVVDIDVPQEMQPQLELSSKPTESPTTSNPTMQPTQTAPSIPLPNIHRIKTACTGYQTVIDIVGGVLNALMECQRVCQPGMCCFSETASCFEQNRVCMAYSDCLVLTMTDNDIVAVEGPQGEPTKDLVNFCSTDSTPAGIFECVKACQPATCCGAVESSCLLEYEDICAMYGPCLELANANGGDTTSMPPIPPKDLAFICSYSSINTDAAECTLACEAGMCCLDNSCLGYDDEESLKDRCELYESCRHLWSLSMPSDELQQVCDLTSSQYNEQSCGEACNASSCCFSDHDPCFANFKESCVAHGPYCFPELSMDESDVITVQLQSPPLDLSEICKGSSSSSACEIACSVAECCFSNSELNCWAENEQTCGEYSICAFLYQDYEESETVFT